MRLITTNNVVEALAEVLPECKSKVCLFVNSIDTIESLYKDMAELKNSATFCSTQGIAKLRHVKDRSMHDRIEELKRYNFFTSRFFSAVDIDVRCKPDIILLSDLYGAEQSVIDPRTEAIQIAGRFRNGFRSLTHITSIKPSLEAMNASEVDEWLESARLARHRQTTRKQRRLFLLEQFERIAFLRFSPDKKDQDRYGRYLSRILSSEYDCMFHECYLRKGADYIRSIDFKDSEIKRAVEEAGSTVFRKKQLLKEMVEKQFRVGETYSRSDLSVILTAAYRKVGLPVNKRLNATQLKDYFEIKEVNITSGRFLKIVGKK